MRAKVVTFVMTANLLAGPIAFALTGPVLDEFGLAPVFLVVAVGVSGAAVVLMTMAGIRDEPAQAPAEAAA